MRMIIKGVKFIYLGLAEILMSICRGFLECIHRVVRKYRRWRLKRATAYVNKYGYELELNSRVRVAGKAYYVFSYKRFEDIQSRGEVTLELISVPQYKEILRRIR